jgi:spore germination protein KA
VVFGLFRKFIRKPPQRKPASCNRSAKKQPETDRRIYNTGELKEKQVSSSLNINLEMLQSILGQNSDIIFRRFNLGMTEETELAVIYAEGITDKTNLNNNILNPLMLESHRRGFNPSKENILYMIKNFAVTVSNVSEASNINELVTATLEGNVILFINNQPTALILHNTGVKSRAISEPQTEILVRGPKEGFIENLTTNISLIRRRLKSPNLIFEDLHIGRITYTRVTITYIKGIASPDLVAEIKRRLGRIDIDGILESGYLEELIEDNTFSPFPQILHTERPDRVAASLLEGRVSILTDGTPFALIAPAEFVSFMTSPEDYYERYWLGTAIRWLRYIAMTMSLLLPSLYIAVTTFHQEMIPTRLLISIAASRQGVPFPALVEALAMEFTFEAIREAGIRLPRAIGQAVSIVGALVIGQAAVQAGIVSPLMIIVVAVTGMASFVNPSYNMGISLRLLRFPMMLLGGTLGLFGIMAGILCIFIHLAGLRSFGVPYLASLAPLHLGNLKDVLIRAPWWAMDKRPDETGKLNSRRQSRGLKPSVSNQTDKREDDQN